MEKNSIKCIARYATSAMASRCNKPNCDCAVTIISDNGVTDPTQTRVEEYECARGHQFTEVLEPLA